MAAYIAWRHAQSTAPKFTCAFSLSQAAMAANGGSRAKVTGMRRQLGSTVALARAIIPASPANPSFTSRKGIGCAVLAMRLVEERKRLPRYKPQKNDLTRRCSERLPAVRFTFP